MYGLLDSLNKSLLDQILILNRSSIPEKSKKYNLEKYEKLFQVELINL